MNPMPVAQKSDPHDICVIGGGPAGLAAALAIAARGGHVLVLAPGLDAPHPSAPRDTRTTAILGDGITFLINLGVWETLQPLSAPLEAIRIIDDRGGWLSAPEVLFQAREMELDAFGFNVPNEPLRAALLARATQMSGITLMATKGVISVVPSQDSVVLKTAEGKVFLARLVVAADGRQSIACAAAGIATRDWTYPQVAIALSFGHARPHLGVSTEMHRRAGPLTTVPLPDDADGPRSSLVWVETPEEAARLIALPDVAFAAALQKQMKGHLGAVRSTGRRGTFPIAGLMAVTSGKGRIVLAGEAAHVLPPIGAQGLNLGFRDAAAIADAVAGVPDPGAPAVIDSYARARAADLVSREIGIDLLNRALLLNVLPVQALRGLGLHALANSRRLRRAAMQMGLAAPGAVPSLMRPLAN